MGDNYKSSNCNNPKIVKYAMLLLTLYVFTYLCDKDNDNHNIHARMYVK